MIKKNSFRNIHKGNNGKSKHINKVIWNKDLDHDKRFQMIDYVSYVKSTDIYCEFNEKINVNLDDYIKYEIVGICDLSNLKMITSATNNMREMMFIITDKQCKLLYISIGQCHPLFWYKFINKKTFIVTFDTIYETYNPIQYAMEHKHKICGFIGNEEILSLGIHDIENHLILNKYTDKLIWGSKWVDYPFRNEYFNIKNTKNGISYIDNIIHTGQAMRQSGNAYSVSVRTNYSKSLITIHYYEDAYILELQYNEIDTTQINTINDIFGRKYNINIPIDIIMTLINFPFITHTTILNMKPLTIFHFYIITLLANEIDIFDSILPQLNTIINDECGNYDNELKEYIKTFIQKCEYESLLNKIIAENNIYELIENEDDAANIDNIISDILEKYKCMHDDYIKNALVKLFMNGIKLINKL